MFGDSANSPGTALQPFEPDASSVYPIETVATLVQNSASSHCCLFQIRTGVAGDRSFLRRLVV